MGYKVWEAAGADVGATLLGTDDQLAPLWRADDQPAKRLAGVVGAGAVAGVVGAGVAAGVVGAGVATAGAGETMFGLPEPVVAPVLESKAVVEPKRQRPPWWKWLLVGGGGAVVVAVGLTLWLTGVLGGGSAAVAPTPPAAASDPGDALPTGLRVDLAAEPDLDDQSVVVTMTLAAPATTALEGDVLVVVPPAAAQPPASPTNTPTAAACPVASDDPGWAAATVADGVQAGCAFKVEAALSANASQTVRFTVAGPWPDDLGAWLTGLRQATDEALRGATNLTFALQLVQGITLQADDVKLDGQTPSVSYRVYAAWSGQASPPGDADLLFRHDTLDFQTGEVFDDLTGNDQPDGLGLSGTVKVEGCSPGTQQGVGIQLTATQPVGPCDLSVRGVGNLPEATTSFTIDL